MLVSSLCGGRMYRLYQSLLHLLKACIVVSGIPFADAQWSQRQCKSIARSSVYNQCLLGLEPDEEIL